MVYFNRIWLLVSDFQTVIAEDSKMTKVWVALFWFLFRGLIYNWLLTNRKNPFWSIFNLLSNIYLNIMMLTFWCTFHTLLVLWEEILIKIFFSFHTTNIFLHIIFKIFFINYLWFQHYPYHIFLITHTLLLEKFSC